MTYDFSELKRVQFSNLIALTIPARWDVETRPDFDWFCTERGEESGSLSVIVDARRHVDGAAGEAMDLQKVVEDMAATFGSTFENTMLENSVTESGHGYVHKHVCKFDEHGETLRSHRYTIVQRHNETFALIFIVLVIREADAERADMRELASIIDKSVQDADLLLFGNRRVSLPDIDELQTIHCGGALSLKVPARWILETNAQDDEGWCCYRRGEESGTLWIAINRFQRPTRQENPDFSLKSYLDHMVASRLENRDSPAFDSKITEIESGYLWCFDFRTQENGDDLHYFRYVFVIADETEVAIVTFGLVVLSAQLQDWTIRRLMAIVDREVRATKLTVFSDAARSRGAVPFPFPEAFSLDGKVQVNLPGFTKLSPQGEGRIYGSFPPHITASMWISISEFGLSDNPFDDDGTIPPEILEFVEQQFADDLHEESVIARFPCGFIFYSCYDDNDQEEDRIDNPAEQWKRFGFRKHHWRYLRIGQDTICQAQFMLMVPVREPDKRELKSLVATLEREIRQAQFPRL